MQDDTADEKLGSTGSSGALLLLCLADVAKVTGIDRKNSRIETMIAIGWPSTRKSLHEEVTARDVCRICRSPRASGSYGVACSALSLGDSMTHSRALPCSKLPHAGGI